LYWFDGIDAYLVTGYLYYFPWKVDGRRFGIRLTDLWAD